MIIFLHEEILFPTPYTVLIIIICMAAVATWLLPAGSFDQLVYDQTNNELVLEGSARKSLPATQATLDELGLQMDIEKFIEGKIEPVAVPNTYHENEAAPQGLKSILFAPIQGFMKVSILFFLY